MSKIEENDKIHQLDNPFSRASELPDELENKKTNNQNPVHQRFAIDFDNTLTIGDNKPWLEDDRPTPNKKNIEIVNQLFFKGNTIIIHSSRPWEFARKTVAWLIENGVLYHGVNFGKANAHVYVDDRNMSIKEFEAIK